ncbi:PrsW family glutamic-type intramembrane protease [Actinoplanes subglobosus]|uniref:PrsW family glutamic-type intramembrane protease n=1 Tax=Actinoplanes subglobosus TaxID=1547892 RepID=A0ABV8IZQ3_9ACTN
MADVSPSGTPDAADRPQSAPPAAPEPPAVPDSPAAPASPAPLTFEPPVFGEPLIRPSSPAPPFLQPPAAQSSFAPSPTGPPSLPPFFKTAALETAPAPVPPYPGVADAANAPLPGRSTGWRRWLPMTAAIVVIALVAIGMLTYLGYNIGVTGLAIGLTAAILPVPLLASTFVWLDRYEPEPTKYLVFCFAWGAAIATAVALVVNTGSAWLFDKIGLPDALVAVLVAPFIEESMKVLGPFLIFLRRRSEWSGMTDGIVYCGLSALGFAMVENVLYLGGHGYAAGEAEYGPATGLQNVFLIFIVRILFTGFAHPLFTSMAGIGLGLSARSGNRTIRWLAPVAGILLAMMLHGIFNLLPTLAGATGETMIMLYGYLGFMVPFFFAVVGLAIALRSWEGRLAERVLFRYAEAGWFAPAEVAALGTLGRRHAAREWARRVAGQVGHRAMRDFQFAATRLALIRDGLERGLPRTPMEMHRALGEERELLIAITNYRSAFAGRDPQTPPSWWDGHNYRITFPDGVVRTVAPPPEPVMPVPIVLPPPPPPAFGGAYGPPPAGPYGGPPPYAPPPRQW